MSRAVSLRTQVLAWVIGAVALGFAVSLLMLTQGAARMQKATAIGHATELARYEAQRVATKLERAMQSTRVLALAVGQLRRQGRADRGDVLQMMEGVLMGQPDYAGVSSAWEPNAFDGQDSAYANTALHDATGRFIPYWYRDTQGKPVVEALVDYEKPGDGDFYLVPKNTRKPTVLEPYMYPVAGVPTMLSTISTPVMDGERFLGMLAVDLPLRDLHTHIQGVRPYEEGYASLVSHQGVYVGDQRDDLVGKPLEMGALTEPMLQAVRHGQQQMWEDSDARTGQAVLRVLVPVPVQDTATPWGFMVTIPMDRVLAQVQTMRWQASAWGIGAALVVMALVVWVLNRLILQPLGGEPMQAAALAAQVAKGDFSQPLSLGRAQPHSVMAQLAQMQRSLAHLVTQVRSSAQGVAIASAEISQGNLDLSQRTETQASALEQTSASMEQLNATVQQNADRSQQANSLASEAAQVASRSGQAMGEMLHTMHGISASSRQIGDIIGVIDSIAFQTNILALNAAVEAARAGEQGRGFAVVATEVRQLAGRSADAAKQIKQLIASSVEQVALGAQQAEKVGDTIHQVVEVIGHVATLMAEVSGASTEQSVGVAQIGEAITHMDGSTQKNAALVEQMAAAAASLNSQAEEMVRLVAVFKLGNETPQLTH